MKLLFIDDCPQEKAIPFVNHLNHMHFDFSYEIAENVNDALIYIFTHLAEIDLIITDLGLPRYKDGSDYNSLNGLDILDELIRKDVSIPVIINSKTKIPTLKEYVDSYSKKNRLFLHVESLTVPCLENYIQKYIN